MIKKIAVLLIPLSIVMFTSIFTGCNEKQLVTETLVKPEKDNDITNEENKNIKEDLIKSLYVADEVILSQFYEPDLQLILNAEQINTLTEKLKTLKPMRTPDIYGSGYPAYEFNIYMDGKASFVVKILDPLTIQLISGGDFFYEGFYEDQKEIWSIAKDWLPLKETRSGTVEHLYKANKVELYCMEAEDLRVIEYDLEKEPTYYFWATALVSILNSAKVREGIESSNKDLYNLKMIFYFDDDHIEEVKVYEHYALHEGAFLEMENISQTLNYIILDGLGLG